MIRRLPLPIVSLLVLVALACCPLLPAQAAEEENCTAQAKAVQDGRPLVLITFRCKGSDHEWFGINVEPEHGGKPRDPKYVRSFWRHIKIETPKSAHDGRCRRGDVPKALAVVGCPIELDGRARFTVGVRLTDEAFCRLEVEVLQSTPIHPPEPGDPPPLPEETWNRLYHGLPKGC